MKKEEYELLKKPRKPFSVDMLKNKEDRTLLYGYTLERDTWHVYLKDGEIIKVIYGYEGKPVRFEIKDIYDLRVDKRLYPARCDFEICKIMKEYDIDLPFTGFEEVLLNGKYYGEILE